jgi:hypothetical protein
MEGLVKCKEELQSLNRRFEPNLTYTVSLRVATKGRYGGESSDKHQTPTLYPVSPLRKSMVEYCTKNGPVS